MRIYDFRLNLSKINFKICGLDPDMNMLCAPVCDCGCGEKCEIVLESQDEIKDFCGSTVYEVGIDRCAVFVITNTDELFIAIKEGETITIAKAEDISDDYGYIGEIVENLELDAFGLLVQVEDELFKIVEE